MKIALLVAFGLLVPGCGVVRSPVSANVAGTYSEQEQALRLLTYLKYFEVLKVNDAPLPVSEKEFMFLVDESDEFVRELIKKSAFKFVRSTPSSGKVLFRDDGSAPQLRVEIRDAAHEKSVVDLHVRSDRWTHAIYRAVLVRGAQGWKIVDWRLYGVT